MTPATGAPRRGFRVLCLATVASAVAGGTLAQAPIVNPGAPGADPRSLRPDEAIALARTAYTRADVQFLQAMIPHHAQALEMALLVKAGFTPVQALAAATSRPAETFRLGKRGRVKPGYRADLLLVEGDPTKEIAHTLRIDRIWKNGFAVDRTPPAK